MKIVYGTPVKILKPFYADAEPQWHTKTGHIVGLTNYGQEIQVRLDNGILDSFQVNELEEIKLENN